LCARESPRSKTRVGSTVDRSGKAGILEFGLGGEAPSELIALEDGD